MFSATYFFQREGERGRDYASPATYNLILRQKEEEEEGRTEVDACSITPIRTYFLCAPFRIQQIIIKRQQKKGDSKRHRPLQTHFRRSTCPPSSPFFGFSFWLWAPTRKRRERLPRVIVEFLYYAEKRRRRQQFDKCRKGKTINIGGKGEEGTLFFCHRINE